VPKVTDEHLAARREQVLAAALVRFARDGFHATTMADVIEESGLSAGAVYRYFPSKDALIKAAIDRALGAAQHQFADVLGSADPRNPAAAVGLLVTRVEQVASTGATDVTRLALQAWAEALRSPMVKQTADLAQRGLRGAFVDYVGRCRDTGSLPADGDPTEVAAAMLSLVLGFVVQRLLVGDVDAAGYARGLAGLLP
jgi:AcrR family transcriptional regulator